MKVLVTGAAGFVGLNIVSALAQAGADVLALARRPPDDVALRFLEPLRNVCFVEGDIRDRDALARLVGTQRVARIVHAAAITSAHSERDDPAGFVETNLGGTLNALEAARAHDVERVVLVSSSGLYGAPRDPTRSIRETDPLQIDNLYTVCKQASEQLCRRYQALFGLSSVAGRLGTAYGPMERPSGSRDVMSPIYRLVAAARAGHEARVYGAERLRDACYVDDAAAAFALLTLAPSVDYPVYNVSSGQAYPLRDVAAALEQLVSGWRWHAVDQPEHADVAIAPAGERGPMDISRLAELGFVPRYGLESGLRRYLHQLSSDQ